MVDLQRDTSAIVTKGGSKWAYKRVKSTGADLDSPDTWHDGVYREKSNFLFNKPKIKVNDESGKQVATDFDDAEFKLVITSLQDDANLIHWLKDETGSAYFAIFLERGTIQGTKKQECFIPVSEVEGSYNSDAPGRRPDITIFPLQYEAAVTPSAVPTWAVGGSGSASGWTCPADGAFVVKDTTSS